jgi:hypothetical protein
MVFDHHECDMENIIKSDQQLSEAHAQYFLCVALRACVRLWCRCLRTRVCT